MTMEDIEDTYLQVPKNRSSPKSADSLSRRNTVHVQPCSTLDDATTISEEGSTMDIGTKVDKNHANFLLMYNMLTGIRMGVSRCNAKPPKPLDSKDFTAAHKLAFDVNGHELIPNSSYDFKFKDYAPFVFKELRSQFRIKTQDYLESLTGKYVLSELGSPGKSGSFFYFSHDYRFIIKTIHHSEHLFLLKILPEYYKVGTFRQFFKELFLMVEYKHIIANPNTLLSRFYGLHRVKIHRGRKIHFVVMSNIFPPSKDIHETYDLKGSAVGRYVSPGAGSVMKDLNWEENKRKLELGPEKRNMLISQVERDTKFLVNANIMDYSLLVGIHNLKKGNNERIRDATLKVFEPNSELLRGHRTVSKIVPRDMHALIVRNLITQSGPVALDSSQYFGFESKRSSVFYSESGGYGSTDDNDEPSTEIYYIAIIDLLTSYNFSKKAENMWKGFTNDESKISAIEPKLYARRFREYIKNAIRSPQSSLTRRSSFNDLWIDKIRFHYPVHPLPNTRISLHSRSSTPNLKEFGRN